MTDQKTVQKTGLVEKEVAPNTFRFVLSDETIDLDGDIIESAGWDLAAFRKNPVALAFHRHDAVVGRWKNVKVEKETRRLVGDLELAPDSVGPLQRSINGLVSGGFIRAVSVGFRGLKRELLDEENSPYSGFRYIKQSLLETSLVSVPSNPSALAIAKSAGLSETECSKLFVPQLSEDEPSTVGSDAEKNPAVLKAKAAILAANKVIRSK